jgi:hypothetical protein
MNRCKECVHLRAQIQEWKEECRDNAYWGREMSQLADERLDLIAELREQLAELVTEETIELLDWATGQASKQ